MRVFISFLATLLLSTSALATPKVIASIMPVHSIVSSVMGDIGTPELIYSGKNSEHSASLSTRQISDLGNADVVFMNGGGLELKLGQISGSESVNGNKFFALTGAPGIKTLKIREGGAFEADDDEELPATTDDQYEFAKKYNVHVWLDPENARAMTKAVAAELSRIDPEHAKTYEANAQTYLASLDQLETDISAETKSIQGKPFIVFHDAYPYFEMRFGLEALGSISDANAASPSARRLKEIRDKIAATNAVCVFREPQFDTKFVTVVMEGTKSKSGILDPIGYDVEPGPKAYEEMMRNLAKSARDCLEN